MRPDGRRTKKLIVAFHFHGFAEQAAWKCDTCRQSGLAVKRRCGWLASSEGQPRRVVWARRKVAVEECPRSFVSGQSLAWIEEYAAWKLLGARDYAAMGARQVEAFQTLENELKTEREYVQQGRV